LKLDKAIRSFSLSLDGCVCIDIGASTGGFTDCMLQNGALKVYAIDVGYGQLDWKLRQDNRVIVMERTNARFMEKQWFSESPAFASIDVAFISLRLILPPLFPCLQEGAFVVALIKPQFEAGREQVKKGIVRDERIHAEVCENVLHFADEIGFSIEALDYSPITGPKGNIEFLALLQKPYSHEMKKNLSPDSIKQTVHAAHEALIKQ
jgi:23S rRNA (cytidine1920-2'-O)/16S rRNA (cytidine1409-2'-O)-methyltransferase